MSPRYDSLLSFINKYKYILKAKYLLHLIPFLRQCLLYRQKDNILALFFRQHLICVETKIQYYIDGCEIPRFPSERKAGVSRREIKQNVYITLHVTIPKSSQSTISLGVRQEKASSCLKHLITTNKSLKSITIFAFRISKIND